MICLICNYYPLKDYVKQFLFNNKYNTVFPIMNQSKCNNFVQATQISSATIDTILTQGANILYDHYVRTKIPKNVRATFEKIIDNVFQPTLNNLTQIEHGINPIHESFIQKINVAESKRKNATEFDLASRNKLVENAKTIEIDKHIARNINIKVALSKKQKSTKRITKESSNCLQSLCSNFGQLQDNEEMLAKRKERQERFKHQLHKDQQTRQRNQKSRILKKQLEQQIRQLQENQKTVTFNHHTGRVFHLAEHHEYPNIKKTIINLRYGLSDQESISKEKGTKQSLVLNSKKILNLQRGRKKFSLINQETNDANYNNHGKRQTSAASFIEIQEGINVYQGKNIDNINYAHNNRKSRMNTASLTLRTFKSYAKEKMESSRFVRTKGTSSSIAKTSNINNESTEERKKQNLMRSSVLWSNRGDSKKHTINKNPQLINNYFDISQQ